MTTTKTKLKHLEWALQSRARNQKCSLRLLRLFYDYEDLWTTKRFSQAGQDLIAVSFSLWRAAFLADRTGNREDVFAHGKEFLEKIIEDNSISYPQDRKSKEWTFNYYTRNARSGLEKLSDSWSETVPAYEAQKGTATARWEYCQKLLDEAVDGFERLLMNERTGDPQQPDNRKRSAKVA